MFDLDKWREIWVTISRNKTRSIMTAFGVSWGLFMFIILVGFGNGFNRGIMENFQGFAMNSCFVYPDRTSIPYKGFRKGRYWEMTSKDLPIIRERVRGVEYLSPMLFLGGNAVRGNKSGSYTTIGSYPELFQIQQMDILYGRLINEIDIIERRKVCTIGEIVYETLFNIGEDPVGQIIKVGSLYYNVVGVVRSKSSVSVGSNPRNTIYIPYTMAQQISGNGDRFDFLTVMAKPGYRVSVVDQQVKEVLKELHDIAPEDDKAVGSFNVEQIFQTISTLFSSVTILIWIVGMGALFSGVVGISNIMLVTVRERMREIGVRRAIGAKPITIITQILSESLVLTTIAGLAGFIFGIAILTIMQQLMGGGNPGGEGLVITPFISFNLAIVAMVILILSGLFAGLMPALRAMKIKAIDAIRDE
jgi:ABC-type antimicrobial peptide transport system, permease component